MPFQELDANMQMALISAGSALLGSIIGAAATLLSTWLGKKMQTSGKVSLYAKMVYSKGGINTPWGYYRSQEHPGLFMQVPIWLDVCNTSGVPRIVRNVNLYAYNKKSEIADFVQIQRLGSKDNMISLGDNGSYTLVIPANSAKRFDMEFMLHDQDITGEMRQFDELILSYFDEKDKIHAFHLTAVPKCWVEGRLDRTNKWISLDRRCDYAR